MAVTFTVLVVSELVMVGLAICTWHWLVVGVELGSPAVYVVGVVGRIGAVVKNQGSWKYAGRWKNRDSERKYSPEGFP